MTLVVRDVRLAADDAPVDVTLSDGLIDAISPAAGPGPAGDDAEVIEGGGGTLLPGLIDAHFHAYGVEIENLAINAHPLSYVGIKGAVRCRAALERGFTTVRDVAGGDPGLAAALRERVLPGPDYFYTGPALSQTGGHGDEHPGVLDLCSGHGHMGEVVDGVDALRAAVRKRFRAGVHAIKVMASGGVVSPTDPIQLSQYSEEELETVCREAARRGSYVAAHAYPAEAVRRAVAAGVRSIEHGNLIDEGAADDMAAAGAFLVPTLVAYDAMSRRGSDSGLSAEGLRKNGEVLLRGQDAVQLAHRAGVRVGWGSDLMGDLEDEQLRGLELQADASGLDETLRSATEVNAELMGLTDRGRIEVGLRADLLILPGRLAEDPALLWTNRPGRIVIQSGRVAARDGRLVD
ncbi:metal-dependent hydrolase family protein [Ornithinimicrobium avium]|uniref:Amidohydrolase family protein n=1 Tax=Ornithinimicrobium avium TaxID=2283195 RepID=A0A345NMX0_9MICO|nr:amidohydrolase family protein [Ornithinimicrobium avium]AXH96378.1 amidohydrolase family protein [Ornithinimicrobium avium]